MASPIPLLALVAPLGFETVVEDEVHEKLGHLGLSRAASDRNIQVHADATSALLRFQLHAGLEDLERIRHLLAAVITNLFSIDSAMVVAGEFDVPATHFVRQASNVRDARTNHPTEAPLGEQPEATGLSAWLAGEAAGQKGASGPTWETALQWWTIVRDSRVARGKSHPALKPDPGNLSFRVTADRCGVVFRDPAPQDGVASTTSTRAIAGALGLGICRKTGWKVDLENFDVEVYVVAQSRAPATEDADNPSVRLVLGIRLPLAFDLRTRNRAVHGRTSLRPSIAYCLARTAMQHPATPLFPVVVDPCCGAGTIPIETAISYPDAIVVAGDFKESSVFEQAHVNVQHAVAPLANTHVDLLWWDGKCLPLRDFSVDVILSDLPWGEREGSYRINCKLYPKLFKSLHRIMRQGAYAHVITRETKLLNRTLENISRSRAGPLFEIKEQRPIRIGFKVFYFAIKRL